jgi:hypothetical protein
MGTLDLLQWAYGWVKPSFYSRLVALLVLGPVMAFMAVRYGAMGAAIAWLLIYAGYTVITPHFVFRRLLKGDNWNWYIKDLGLPSGVAFATTYIWHFIFAVPVLKQAIIPYLAAALFTTSLVTATSMFYTRALLKNLACKVARVSFF